MKHSKNWKKNAVYCGHSSYDSLIHQLEQDELSVANFYIAPLLLGSSMFKLFVCVFTNGSKQFANITINCCGLSMHYR